MQYDNSDLELKMDFNELWVFEKWLNVPNECVRKLITDKTV